MKTPGTVIFPAPANDNFRQRLKRSAPALSGTIASTNAVAVWPRTPAQDDVAVDAACDGARRITLAPKSSGQVLRTYSTGRTVESRAPRIVARTARDRDARPSPRTAE